MRDQSAPHPAGDMRALTGRWLVPLVAGTLAATGFQPLMLWPVTVAAMALLIAQIEAAPRPRHAALTGWLFGAGLFSLGNCWIATAFTYQAQMPEWLGWVAVVLLAGYLAIFPALAAWATALLHQRYRAPLVPTLAACWIVAEWLRSWVFTGFPWNPLGAITLGPFDRPGLATLSAWVGTYGLAGLVVLLSGLWLWGARALIARRMGAGLVALLVPLALMAAPVGGDPHDSPLAYTLVQPDLAQDQINDPRLFESQFARLASLSQRIARNGPGPRIVLWPEGAVPDYLRPGYDQAWYDRTTYGADPALARQRMGRVIGADSLLMAGTTDLAITDHQVTGAWNVITLIDAAGAIRGGYAKAHLVPYGEYLPLRPWLTPLGLSRLVSGDLDFRPGPGPRTLDLGAPARGGWGRAGFQICYEIVFPGHVINRADRPDYLFNPSDDGWFGPWGPPQHLAQARLRAIEEGIPVLRSTTTGISAVIDAGGAVRYWLAPGQAARADGQVPAARPPTWFAQVGNGLSLLWAVVVLVSGLVATRTKRR